MQISTSSEDYTWLYVCLDELCSTNPSDRPRLRARSSGKPPALAGIPDALNASAIYCYIGRKRSETAHRTTSARYW